MTEERFHNPQTQQGFFSALARPSGATGMHCVVMGLLTRLLARGAGSGVLGEVDSFGVSEVELRDELLLESSLFCLLVPNGKRKATKSETSFCSSL